MADELTTLRAVLDDVAGRRRALAWRRAWTQGAVVAAAALTGVWLVLRLIAPVGLPYLLLVGAGTLVAIAALVVGGRPRRDRSTRVQRARLLEERIGGLDDVVVSAVDYGARDGSQPAMAGRLAASALRALGPAPAEAIVPAEALQRSGRAALAATIALGVGVLLVANPLRQAAQIAAAYVLPSWVGIQVEPGHVKVRAGRPVTIRAHVTGGEALAPALVIGEGSEITTLPMQAADSGYSVTVADVTASFPYHVAVGARRSETYAVTVVHPARVERIDLDYSYPPALRLDPRREEDGGDIYAPEGTEVRLAIRADRPVASAALVLGDGSRVALGVRGTTSSGALTVAADGSYRITFVDDDGEEMPDDTEYFIRTLLDRPPDVRVMRPGGDKQVTPLEEVKIEARADDDFGVRSFDLVLQKPGDAEVTVPLQKGPGGLTVNGEHTLYLEDLEVQPGDVVSYYVKARDIGRGKPSSESRSDMYFLEVKAFNDEFVAAQSQAMAAGSQSEGVQDLAAAQKEIVVATWKLDSRGRRANRAASARDIAAVAEAQRALEQRAAREAGSQLQSSGGPAPRRRRGPATLNTVGDDPMGLAIEAMRRATTELDQQKTSSALPHEMEALNQLLRAESDVRRRQIARQQGGGGGGNRQTPDLSALFDQELRKQQETNYETPASSETRQDARKEEDPLEKLRELSRRQEALSREQQDLARTEAELDRDTVKRRLERLSREQEDLRRQLEQLTKDMPKTGDRQADARRESSNGAQQPQPSASSQPSPSQSSSQSGQSQSGQSQSGQSQSGQSQSSSSGKSGNASGATGQQPPDGAKPSERDALAEAMNEMQQASAGLRDRDASGASQRAARALERMRRAEDAMRGSTAGDLRQQLGDAQIEARQLADAQRRLGEQARRLGAGKSSSAEGESIGREQTRLAGRADRLRQRLRGLADQAPQGPGREAAAQAARELEAGKAADLMREASRALDGRSGATPGTEASADRASSSTPGQRPGAPASTPDTAARLGADAARVLDRVAERLDEQRTGDGTAAGRLSDDLAKTRALREQLDNVERSLEQLRATERQAADASRRSDGRQGSPSAGEPRSGSAAGEIARLQRQLADDMREARAQVDALGRSSPDMRAGSTPESWQPSVSAPGTEAFKQDFARWEVLKKNMLLALEKVERGAADELRAQETRDRLNAGASDAVPDDYRRLVDRYYRSLAAPRRPGS